MTKISERRIKFMFYGFLNISGFALLFADTTAGHNVFDHIVFFKNNIDAIEGVILIFISGFQIGKMLRRGYRI